jgi:ribosomal protein S18 acetylase RimI-like enzyme
MSVTASASAEPAAGLSPATADDATQLAGMLARSFESCPAWGAFLPADSKRRPERMARFFGFMLTGLRHLPRTIACFNAMDAGHPTEPHWYLSVLGVEPAARKAGVAETLILAGLERCDRERRPA